MTRITDEHAMTTLRLRARWIFPVDAPPVENGTLEIADGRILALHNKYDLRAQDLGNVALIPGLVNAHAHLEFSDLSQPVKPAEPFTEWIRSLVATRRGRTGSPTESVSQGQSESHASGVSTIGEISTADNAHGALSSAGPQLVLFREILGLLPQRRNAQLEIARAHLNRSLSSGVSRVGLSPHAPYSVHPDLFRDLVELAKESNAPVAIHLAETRAELELLRAGAGEFVTMLNDFEAWDPKAIPRGSRPLDYLRVLASLTTSLAIHGNYFDDEEIAFLADNPQIAVVYCPRTHAFFRHTPHPWRTMLSRGISLAIGTDGRGSNPDLSLWNELRFLRKLAPAFPTATLLRLGTLSGAEALGLSAETGSLTPGKRADIAVVLLPEVTPSMTSDPAYLLFSAAAVHSLAAWLQPTD